MLWYEQEMSKETHHEFSEDIIGACLLKLTLETPYCPWPNTELEPLENVAASYACP